MMRLHVLLPLGLFVVVLAFLGTGLKLNPSEVPSPFIGKPAPAFALQRLDNPEQQMTRDELIGQPWVLNVWASWCAPCRAEHPLVIDIAQRSGVAVYGLNYKDQPAAARAWLASLGDPYRATLIDADGRVGIDYGVYGVPETFLVDRHGVVRFKHVGPLTPEVVRDKVEPLLQQLKAEA